jgi:hypothetical protein
MKILRSVSQRGFSVGTAGWFTILRPNSWFPASRLPGIIKRFGIQTGGTAELIPGPSALCGGREQGRNVSGPVLVLGAEDRHWMRLAAAIFGALAITSAMLWWIMHP